MPTAPTPEVAAVVAALGDALGAATRPSAPGTDLKRALADIRSLFDAEACSCARADFSGETLTFIAADGRGADAIVGVQMPVSRGIAGWVATSGQPMVAGDLIDDSRFARDIAEATNYVPNVIIAAPIVDDAGETVGVIEVLDPGWTDSGRGLDTLSTMANQIGAIIKLSETYDAMGSTLLRALASAVDPADVSAALAQFADERTDAADLAALAAAFAALAQAGPDSMQRATSILTDVAALTSRRR